MATEQPARQQTALRVVIDMAVTEAATAAAMVRRTRQVVAVTAEEAD